MQPTTPPSVEYALTPLGQELIPALNAIVAVGLKFKEAKAKRPGRKRSGDGPPGSRPAA